MARAKKSSPPEREDAGRTLARLMETRREGGPVHVADVLAALQQLLVQGRLMTLEPFLPILLRLKGRPLTLENHFPLSPFFRLDLCRTMSVKAGRQIGKSLGILAANGVMMSAAVPNLSTLYVTPLADQIARFSNHYVKPLIEDSPIKPILIGDGTVQNVFSKVFRNGSRMTFSYALRDADRIRGSFADINSYDEVQNQQLENVDIIKHTMSASDWKLDRYAGTPLTYDGLVQYLYDQSSQAEWWIPCTHCTDGGRPTINIPSAEYHLDAMIGPAHPGISEDCPGTICRLCREPISPRHGFWKHRYPERLEPPNSHAGYHLPQIIFPRHYANFANWAEICDNRENQSPAVFHNETLGESYDVGSKLVTLEELKAACRLPWRNTWKDPKLPPDAEAQKMVAALRKDYQLTVLAADWGGGGKHGDSFTKLALLGWRSNGKIDVLWGKKLLTPHDPVAEADEAFAWAMKFGVNYFAHDFTGAGALRERFIAQCGYPVSRIVPIALVPYLSTAPMIPVADVARPYFELAKTRSLLLTCTAIRLGQVGFFAMDFVDKKNPGLVRDFLALVDEKNEATARSDIYIIRKQDKASDDFAQAVNLGCAVFWYKFNAWPDVAQAAGKVRLTSSQQLAAFGRLPDLQPERTRHTKFQRA